MSAPILHHYPASPFAEKIRLVLGFKGIDWQSVTIPVIMPKPDLVALTGGYRRTPVLQVGADVYCDTSLIVRVLERLAPSPTLYPDGDTLAVQALCHFADQVLFNVTVPLGFTPEGIGVFFPGATPEFLQRFREDRAGMRKGGTARRGPIAECQAVYAHLAPKIEAQFSGGQGFLLGNMPCAADFAVYHTLWPLTRVANLAPLLEPFTSLRGWLERMRAIGHGRMTAIDSGEALRAAREGRPAAIAQPMALHTEDLALGETVEVLPVDYALDPVRGELLNASADEIAVRRDDPRAGAVVVHFPRWGFQLRRPA